MSNITILGSGFAALTAVKRLRAQRPHANITVISPKAEMIYYPSLIWVPTGLRTGDDLRVDLTAFFKRMNVTHVAASVTGLTHDGRTVQTTDGDFHNDGLIIGTGGRFMKKLPGIEHAIALCEGIPAAQAIRDRIAAMRQTGGGTITFGFASNPNEQAAMRGGPMFELLFGIDTWMRKEGIRDMFKLNFVSPAARPGQRLGDAAVTRILDMMAKKDITPHLGHKMVRFEEKKIVTEGTEIDTDLILFMPGMTGPAWAEHAGVTLSAGGFFPANAYAQVQGLERVYVAGDAGSYPGPEWLPKQAHMADLHALAAVDNLIAELDSQPVEKKFKIELVCIMDMYDKAVLVFRNEKRSFLLPCRLLHWAKIAFEWLYLRDYRR
jgi:sulfide:quinone oxidoreductase